MVELTSLGESGHYQRVGKSTDPHPDNGGRQDSTRPAANRRQQAGGRFPWPNRLWALFIVLVLFLIWYLAAGPAAYVGGASKQSNVQAGTLLQMDSVVVEGDGVSTRGGSSVVSDAGFHGAVGLTQAGEPSWSPTPLPGTVHDLSAEENREAHRGYCFNSRMSDSLSLDRPTPDFRLPKCKRSYKISNDTQASVVMIFHNELLSVLLRSIHSVLNRSPRHLLKEIILLNDASDRDTHPWLYDDLSRHIQYLPKVQLHTLSERAGLMMARVRGAEHATAKIIIFLDSHIEASSGWIEPLLEYCEANPRAAATPTIG